MVKLSGSQALGAGFGVIGRHPMALVAWGLAYMLIVSLPQVIGYGLLWPDLMHWMHVAATADKDLEGAQAAQFQARMLPFQLLQIPFLLAGAALLYGAVYRAVLEPENRAFFYLRVGAQEGWLFLGFLATCLLFMVFSFTLSFLISFTVGLIGRIVTHGYGTPSKEIALVVTFGVCIWLGARLSLALPMTFAQRRFRLFESWSLTRGHAWKIVAVILTLFLIVLMIYLALVIGLYGAALAIMSGHGAPVRHLFAQDPQVWLPQVAPWLAAALLVYVVIVSAAHAIVLAPFADIYRQLTAEPPGPADFGGV